MSTSFDTSQVRNNFPNPLDDFVSHSYHFIMSVSNTTTAFEGMIDQGNGQNLYLSKVNDAKHPGAEITLANGEKAWVIVDTRRFSAYQITDLQMSHIYGTGKPHNPSVPAGETSMRIVDSTGMSFFNMLIDLFRNKIKSTRSSCFFMLSIVFVGHKADGTTETIAKCNIPLLLMTMEFSLDHKGSIYELIMMETEGGIQSGNASMSLLDALGDVQSIEGDATVGAMIQSLENALNTKSAAFFRSYTNDAFTAQTAAVVPPTPGQTPPTVRRGDQGKLVQYMITVPKEWYNFKCDTAARDFYIEQIHEAEEAERITEEEAEQQITALESLGVSSEDGKTQMSFSDTTTITDAIKMILETSVDVLKLQSEENRRAGTAKGFKTVMNITSSSSSYVVHYDVFPFSYPKIEENAQSNTTENAGSDTIQPATSTPIDNTTSIRNLMTYDYIFTGRNSHILDLKIKYDPASAIALDMTVDIGQNRFASNAAAGQTRRGAEQAAEDGNRTRTTSYNPNLRQNDPIIMPRKSKNQADNSAAHHVENVTRDESIEAMRARQEYTQSTAYMHFISSLNLNMQIRGNPNLLIKYADRDQRGGMPPHPTSITSETIQSILSSAAGTDPFKEYLQSGLASDKEKYYLSFVKPRIDSVLSATAGDNPVMNGPDISVSPVFCKLNLLAPNIDYTTGDFSQAIDRATGQQVSMFTDEFFYKGPYMVLVVQHIFEGGNFHQDLSMIPYDVSGTGDIMGHNTDEGAVE